MINKYLLNFTRAFLSILFVVVIVFFKGFIQLRPVKIQSFDGINITQCVIKDYKGSFLINNFGDTKLLDVDLNKGRFYRLSFKVRVEFKEALSHISSDVLLLTVYSQDRLGNRRNIGQYSILQSEIAVEKDFQSSSDALRLYANLRSSKDVPQIATTFNLYISSLSITELKIANEQEMERIRPSDELKIEKSLYIDQISHTDFKVLRQQKAIGQNLELQKGYISEIGLLIKFNGNGGSGRYRLGIYNLDDNKITQGPFAWTYFNVGELNKFRDNEGKIDDLYIIPLNVHIYKQGKYVIALDSSQVEVNYKNSIKLGVDKNYNDGVIIEKYSVKSGERMSVKVYGNFSEVAEEAFITVGTKAEHLGNQSGKLYYQLSRSSKDMFNFRGEENDKLGIFTEPKTGVVLADKHKTKSMTFIFRTPYDIEEIAINAKQRCGFLIPIRLYYSLEGTNWYEVRNSANKPGEQVFAIEINSVNSKTAFLKIEPNTDVLTNVDYNYYGLSDLNIEAHVIME